MNAALDGAVELLDRSLAYTRVVLADVRPDLLDRPTPCAGWRLVDLLAHMEDALDAFTEAASGRVEVASVPETRSHVESLREKACALLGAWAAAADRLPDDTVPGPVDIGGLGLDAPLLVAAAALEITLHGWDVGQATGRQARIPEELARGLLAVAQAVIHVTDRGPRFEWPLPTGRAAAQDERLLAWSGRSAAHRMTGPASVNRADPRTRRGMAS